MSAEIESVERLCGALVFILRTEGRTVVQIVPLPRSTSGMRVRAMPRKLERMIEVCSVR